jgi:hypothetical protein
MGRDRKQQYGDRKLSLREYTLFGQIREVQAKGDVKINEDFGGKQLSIDGTNWW